MANPDDLSALFNRRQETPWRRLSAQESEAFCRLTDDPQIIHHGPQAILPAAFLLSLAVGWLARIMVPPGYQGFQRRYEQVRFPVSAPTGCELRLCTEPAKIRRLKDGQALLIVHAVLEGKAMGSVMEGRFSSVLVPHG